ncbi:MAG: nucleotide exchange factor GrpE [Alphaproteobacteria bacterium]|nr:MAG: nucleotide exchange factor GrpE [Alphaproteobacteria bacterium]
MTEEKDQEVEVDPIEELQEKVKALESEVLRGRADLENTRKRFEKERVDAAQFGAFRFAKDLLKVIDGLEMALQSIEKTQDVKSTVDGIKMIHQEFDKILNAHGVKKVDSLHHELDPNVHEVVTEIEDETSEHPSQTVVRVMQEGYKMHERLLRPAMVGVKK